MKDYIEERVLEVAQYIIDSKATIRKTAKVFGVSKSTIHKDMTERLPKINPAIAEQTHLILELNKSERHIRGGKATKMKYKVENLKDQMENKMEKAENKGDLKYKAIE